MPVYVGINWHKLVFDTDWQKLGLCRHFANPGWHKLNCKILTFLDESAENILFYSGYSSPIPEYVTELGQIHYGPRAQKSDKKNYRDNLYP